MTARRALAPLFLLVSMLCALGAAAAEDRNVWDLTELYASPDAWKTAYAKTKADVEKLDAFKGTLGKSAASLDKALLAISDASRAAGRLAVYAELKADEDLSSAPDQERRQLAEALGTAIGEKTSWVAPEILKVGAKKVQSFLKQNKDLTARFDFFLNDTLRAAPHTLSPEGEGVIAAAGDVLQQPHNIRGQLTKTDLPFPTVTLSDGTKVKMDDAAYTKWRRVESHDDRKKVFDAMWSSYHAFQSTLGATLTSQVMGTVFNAKVRHYPNALAAATFADNMPEAVYRMLVAQANAGLPVLHRYLKLRKQLLGLKGDLGYEDMYPSMFKMSKPMNFSVDDSKRITLEALKPYGDTYLSLLKKGFDGRWMHAYPKPHKQSGAYMNGSAYDVHPFLLLNHNDDFEALSTLAHEWGHAVHTLLANKAQPFDKAAYSTFTAETASIGNEMMLNDYLVANAKTKEEKLYYLGQGLESIRTTFFRQTMLAEFQLAIHEELEAGRPLSGDRMTKMYCDVVKKYYGEAQGVSRIDPAYCIEWAYIPHFYMGFYVWQYATSMAGAAQLTSDIRTQGDSARDRFVAMLSAGGSDYPYNLYKKAGIDMATPAPYQKLVARMSGILDQIDALEKQK